MKATAVASARHRGPDGRSDVYGGTRERQRELPLAYFTDGDDVTLIASNYGGDRPPPGLTYLLAHPGASCASDDGSAPSSPAESTAGPRTVVQTAVDRLAKGCTP